MVFLGTGGAIRAGSTPLYLFFGVEDWVAKWLRLVA